jgi:hypothetical protein
MGGFSQFWNMRRYGKFNSNPMITIADNATLKTM